MAITKKALAEKIKESTQRIGRDERTLEAALKSMAQTYRYTFENQIAIFSQKEDVKAVASMQLWNRLHRNVRKGHAGIRLLRPEDFLEQIYVWDIDDTEGESITLWQLSDAAEESIKLALDRLYGEKEESLQEKITRITKEEAEDVYMQKLELLQSAMGSFTDASLAGIEKGFDVAAKMADYICRVRCGYETGQIPPFGFYDIPERNPRE